MADSVVVGALDVGGTTTRAALVSDGEVRGFVRASTPRSPELVEFLAGTLEALLGEAGMVSSQLDAVGLSVPGPLTPDRRRVAFTGNLELRDSPLADDLEMALHVPVEMDDDANCAALGESSAGAGRGASVVLLVVAGTGVGGGLVIDNKIFRGAHAVAGEIGHIALQPDGPRCSCGSFGCLEAFASGPALAERGKGAMVRREAPILAELADNRIEKVTAVLVAAAAQRGDPGAAAAIVSVGRALGLGVAAAVSLFDPEIVVLGGSIGLLPAVVEAVRETVRHRCIAPLNHLVRVEPAYLGDRAGVVGAAFLASEGARGRMTGRNP